MLEEKLVTRYKNVINLGIESGNVNDVLLIFELFKQISNIDRDLKEELEDMAIRIQQITTNIEKVFWFEIEYGLIKYGEGRIKKPSFTFSCTLQILLGILFGEIDMTSAYMAGDITVEGNLQDAMAFQEIIELCLEFIEDYLEELDSMNKELLNLDLLVNLQSIVIKNIDISNFKSFQYLNFTFKKINIILGPNNSGKSNILRLLLLLKQSFTSSLESPLILNGNLIDLGSFKDLTYKLNMREIILKYLLEIKFQSYKTKRIYSELVHCEFHYSFNEKTDDIVIDEFEIKIRNHTIMKFLINTKKNLIINNLNEIQLQNRFLEIKYNLVSKLEKLKDKLDKIDKKDNKRDEEKPPQLFPDQNEIVREISRLNDLKLEFFLSNRGFFPELSSSVDKTKIRKLISDMYPIEYILEREIKNIELKRSRFGIFEKEVSEYTSGYSRFVKFIDNIRKTCNFLRNIKENLSKYFGNEFYIGPLRVSPKRYYPVIGELAKDVGFRGEYLPQLLKMFKEEHQYAEYVKKINFWVKNFEMGTNVKIKKFREIPELISIMFKEYYSGFETNLIDMGIGTSQVLPIIIEGFLIEPNSILIIEQPEIHLHPKAQSIIGDLLIEIAEENKALIVETHSEHLIQRIQRRIAEGKISNDDVIFYYISMTKEGSKIEVLEIDEDGYIKNIPEGFFDEDYKEASKHLDTIIKKNNK